MVKRFDPAIGRATRWRKGQASPNPSGRPKKTLLTEAYRSVLGETFPGDKNERTFAEVIAFRIAISAARGDLRAALELADRTEGRVRSENEVRRTLGDPTLPSAPEKDAESATLRLIALTERIRARLALRVSSNSNPVREDDGVGTL
jgi:hypothetical protein